MAQGKDLTKKQSFLLSLTYVLGMALTYTAAGIAAGLSGRLMAAALQNPWVLSLFALIFVLLALSMFGFYELKVPSFIQSKLTAAGNTFKGGKVLGVFIMGLLSALIVGPCVTPPLAGALLFIGGTHNVWLGGSALFALSLGMGLPLLIIGTSAGALLPKAGRWMQWVNTFCGVLLLAVAFWIISPLVPQFFTSSISFQRITDLNKFDSVFREKKGGPVMLYVSADWCVSCKEIELITFRDKEVKEKLKSLRRLKADVTQTNQASEALLKKFRIFGPPAILFFDERGEEIPETRIIGFQKAEEFRKTLDSILRR
jgi:thiol:disulfide interchange protein DsbD